MKIAYFDCFSGISGDMVLGALIDLGLPLDVLLPELKKIALEDYTVEAAKERRGAIVGTRVLIRAGAQPHRHFSHIRGMFESSGLAPSVIEKALAVFDRLAVAESRVHGVPVPEVHFHETGAADSILDIAGAAIGLDYFGIEKLVSSPLPLGGGTVKTEHGLLPVPAPATVFLLEGVPVYGGPARRELVTPTGAAIVAALAESFGPAPAMTLRSAGYGAGSHPEENPPNMLRVLLGEAAEPLISRTLLLIETNIDDMNPEFYNYVFERLLALGALDVWMTPVQMKKMRPAVTLSVLIDPGLQDAATELLFKETTTIGLRIREVDRIELPRETRTVSTPFGPCVVKWVMLPGGEERLIPEYEECRRIAREKEIPLRRVYEEILPALKK